jgi:hypothetical protein
MEKFNLKQLFGGVSITFFVLFSLIIASSIQKFSTAPGTLQSKLDTTLVKPLSPAAELNRPAVPDNIISGSFNPANSGEILLLDEVTPAKILHYKAIYSEKLKNKTLKPNLKLEIAGEMNNLNSWKNTEWSWIDYDQGILYFYFKAEENGVEYPSENYTGNFQLILQ